MTSDMGIKQFRNENSGETKFLVHTEAEVIQTDGPDLNYKPLPDTVGCQEREIIPPITTPNKGCGGSGVNGK